MSTIIKSINLRNGSNHDAVEAFSEAEKSDLKIKQQSFSSSLSHNNMLSGFFHAICCTHRKSQYL